MTLAKQIGLIAIGFGLAFAFSLTSMDLEFVKTIRDRTKVRTYELFDPIDNSKKKHILLGNCFTVNNVAYTDLWGKKPDVVYRHGTAFLGQVMSYLLSLEYGNDSAKFYDMGSPDTLVTEHIFQLGHLIKASNIKTLIYTNINWALYSFREKKPESTLQASVVLEHWKDEFPEARPHIENYLKSLYESKQYKKTIKKYPNGNFLSQMDSKIFPIGYSLSSSQLSLSNSNDAFNKFSTLRNYSVRSYSHIKRANHKRWEQQLETNALKALALYQSPANDKPLMMWKSHSKLTIDPKKRKEFILFLHIMGEICKARGIKLIYYYPPMMGIERENYENIFKPNTVNYVQNLIAPYGGITIDHSFKHNQNPYDMYWKTRKKPPVYFKRGFETNIIGNFKRGRALIEEMAELGLVQINPNEQNDKPWSIAALPKVETPIREFRSH
jgi:hypothetical protein